MKKLLSFFSAVSLNKSNYKYLSLTNVNKYLYSISVKKDFSNLNQKISQLDSEIKNLKKQKENITGVCYRPPLVLGKNKQLTNVQKATVNNIITNILELKSQRYKIEQQINPHIPVTPIQNYDDNMISSSNSFRK